ncbi:hypothetical protein BO86DRAFT_388632 [Aspergillus japonicus CBS 114.51]|uniref:Uncharacterized protein n=1 Tax=Aspergillus japonicus CBS 114.51 TaxID=1448312 RepID=A0A8T8X324_ASPJA|nr:hypothetical protein BO86DRAFT_388632 [Aspergillus japonicus CBS 114.51]RAH82476.1 hypothetical protein BO86DRAFT_388632 [Aspergillus japonicus CBS 114.51]
MQRLSVFCYRFSAQSSGWSVTFLLFETTSTTYQKTKCPSKDRFRVIFGRRLGSWTTHRSQNDQSSRRTPRAM